MPQEEIHAEKRREIKDEKEKPSSIKQMEVEGEKMAAGEGVGGGLTGRIVRDVQHLPM